MAIVVKKGNGEFEEFDRSKLETSLILAGADETVVEEIVSEIEKTLKDGMTTKTIYRRAFEMLKDRAEKPVAARYSLRRAVMDLGPSGYPFESLIAEIFRHKKYEVGIGVNMQGKCITHEVDVVAEKKDKELILIEAKFHNSSGFKTDVKIALYIQARAEDLIKTKCDGKQCKGVEPEFWLMTNTKFSKNAIKYSNCSGLKLVGWNYPIEGNLQKMIEEAGLHPLTCLTTLSKANKKQLFDKGIVLCRNIKEDHQKLKDLGISDKKVDEIMEEVKLLCRKG